MTARIRLHIDRQVTPGQEMPLTQDQAHYLATVMRRSAGEEVLIFDGQSGEWLAEVTALTRKQGALRPLTQTRPQQNPPDLWLIFAPIKKARTDFIVEKAAEMGADRILPVQTQFTNSERIRQDRLQAHAVEAAEQCGGTFVPQVEGLQKLVHLLANWPADRRLMFCDEGDVGQPQTLPARGASDDPWAILIGPEGGFAEGERARLRAMDQTVPVALGPRILRADTAAVAALTLWQTTLGDWR